MAIKIYEQFAPFANPADGDYPYGSIKNDSIPGAEDGTPLDATWGNDYAGFDAALLGEAGIVPSGQPDKLGASQRVDALFSIFILNKSTFAAAVASAPSLKVRILATHGYTLVGIGSNNYARDADQTVPTSNTPYRFADASGTVWRSLVIEQTPEHFGAIPGVGNNASIGIQALEDWGKAYNKPTYYNPVIYELQSKVVISRAPQMHGNGGGNGSLRTKKLVGTRELNGTIFLSKVVGDYCVEVVSPIFDFGGRIENITTLGRISPSDPRIVGHGWRVGSWGWPAQVNNIHIEDFQGKGLSIGYLQDTVFNSLTIIGCSNGPQEPELEFTAESNFIYFNNPHLEECSYMIRCADGTNTPWEVHFDQGHFEIGNYFAGKAADAPDPSVEFRYTSPPIYAGQFLRDWTFSGCKFVPCSVQALAADSDGLTDNKPHFIRFDVCAGITFDGRCRFENGVGGIDSVLLSAVAASGFGQSNIIGATIVNANPFRYSVDTINTDIIDLDMHFYTGGGSVRCYGINANNGTVDHVTFSSIGDLTPKTEGYLVNSSNQGKTKVGTITNNLSIAPFKWVNKLCQSISDGLEPFFITTDVSIDLEKLHPDVTLIHDGVTPVVITSITNPMVGKELSIINRGAGNVTVTPTATVKVGAGNVIGQDVMIRLYADGNVLYRV